MIACFDRLRGFGVVAAVATSGLIMQAVVAWADAPANLGPMERAMASERVALEGKGGQRVKALLDASRPKARGEAQVTMANRNTPEPQKPSLPASFAALDALPETTGNKQWHCLATAIYFESRGEPLRGQIAVGEVILNRVASRGYPSTVCRVTNQGVGSGRACQFSYACDGRADVMSASAASARAGKLASLLLSGVNQSVTDGATHFHANYVRPSWSRQLSHTTTIGQHLFYRQGTRIAAN